MPTFRKIVALAPLAASLAATPLAAQTVLRMGDNDAVETTLDENDPRDQDGQHFDAYVVQGDPGQWVEVQMISSWEDFEPRVLWGSSAGGGWRVMGEEPEETSIGYSWVAVQLDDRGRAEVRAGADPRPDRGRTGSYHLYMRGLYIDEPGRIAAGQTVSGTLEDVAAGWLGLTQTHYVVEGEPGDTITVTAHADSLDMTLRFGVWNGGILRELARDDDSGPGKDAEMVGVFGEGGEHHIVVSSFSGRQRGPYTLSVRRGTATRNAADPLVFREDREPQAVSPGSTLPDEGPALGTLDADDPVDAEGHHYEDFRLYLHDIYWYSAGIAVSSADFDVRVSLGYGTGDAFRPLVQDDNGGGGQNALLRFKSREPIEYTVRVSSARPGQTGAYRLHVGFDD